jgi:DNA-binding transcriptional MerR regulator
MSSYKLEELAEAAGIAPRTVRYYVQRGLLPAPDFRGSHTTYGDEHLLRLRAIKRLQEERLALEEIQSRLEGLSRAELEQLVSGRLSIPHVRPSPHVNPYVTVGTPKKPTPSGPYRGNAPIPYNPPHRESWERIEIAPGVELHVRADVSDESLRIAREIESKFSKP